MKTILKIQLATMMAGLFFCSQQISSAQIAKKPVVGDQSPLVSGIKEDGKTWTLGGALKTNAVLLYFYPKDETPGCTKEACGLRDKLADLKKAGVEVVGVSFDSVESHKAFIEHHKLGFSLLSDSDGKIADAYGVRAAGKNTARRVSFLISKEGKVLHVTDSPQADVHLSEMTEAVAKLEKK